MANDIITIENPTNVTEVVSPIIDTSVSQVNSLFPTSSWSAWDERTLPWEGIESGRDLSHILNTDQVWDLSGLNYGFEIIPLFGIKEAIDTERRTREALSSTIGNEFTVNRTGRIEEEFSYFSTPIFGIFRDDNHHYLGSGTKRFVPIGNERTKELCDILHGMGFSYENAGCFDGGKVTYVSMKWRQNTVAGEAFNYYVVIINSFDGTKPFGVYITPIRISCKNTMNLAIRNAVRFWKLRHTTNAHIRLEEVENGLALLGNYIGAFEREVDRMKLLTCDKDRVKSFIDMLFPITDDMQPRAVSLAENKRAEVMYRWEYAPDLDGVEETGVRFIYSITDYIDHAEPLRKTSTWKEKRFSNNIDGNELLNKAYELVNSL